MEMIPTNRILDFNTDQMQSIRKEYNLDKPGDMSRAIDVLEAWIKTQEHFVKKDFPRNFLEKAILASKGSLERTKHRLDKLCTYRTAMPRFFGDNLTKNKFEEFEFMFKSALFPKPTDEHYRIYFFKCTGSQFNSNQILNFCRHAVLVCEYIMAYDYSAGVIVVIDYNDANMYELVKALNLTDVRQIIAIVTEGFAMRLKGIHLMTPSKAIDTLVTIIKQFLSPKLAKRMYVHKDISTVYKYVPKDLFPAEYDGKQRSLEKLRGELLEELNRNEFINYIDEMSKAKTDESLRPVDAFNESYLGMPGSFRTLNVD